MAAGRLRGHGKAWRILAGDGIETIAISTIGEVKLFLFHSRDEQRVHCLYAMAS